MASGRIACCVPGCKRTLKPGIHAEWCCAKHWPGVDKKKRERLELSHKRLKRVLAREPQLREYWKYPPGSKYRILGVRIWRLHWKIWGECKTQAIERAMGI